MKSRLQSKKIVNPLFWMLFSILVGCKSIEPLPPEEKIIDPPIKTAKLSFLSIPVEMSLKNSFSEAEKNIPKKFVGEEKSCEGLSYTYQINRNPIQFKTNTNGLDFSTDIEYSLKLSYCPKCTDIFSDKENCIVPRFYGSCGVNESMRKATISFSNKLGVLPNYTLKAETALSNLQLVDPCEITLVNYNITTMLEKEIKKEMKTIEREIDSEISKIDVRSSITTAWNELQKPIKIDSYGYLSIMPEKISMSPLRFMNNHVYFDLGITAKPIVRTEISKEKPIQLPDLTDNKRENGFNLTIDIFASYDSLNNWILNAVKNKPIEINKRIIFLDTVRIIGADGSRLFTEVFFSGARKGKIYFSVKPNLDINQQKITISDLQMDLKSKNVLLKTAKWLLNEKINQKLEREITFDLKTLIGQAKKEITKTLNAKLNDQIQLKGSLESMKIHEIYPLKKGVFIRSEMLGQLKLIIQ
jgi:hypothetical protein